jgi:subtilisin family serine protease
MAENTGKEAAAVVVVTGAAAPAVVSNANYIALAIQAKQQGFLEANEGLDLDYVRMGQYLKISKKGNFVEARDETVGYGDNIDVVIAKAEKRYTLWGLEDSPEDGQLIVSHQDEATATAMLENWLASNPDRAVDYSVSDIQLRLTTYLVPVRANGQTMLGPDQAPSIYLMSFPQGDTYGFGNYAMGIYDGKAKAIGVPAATGANKVVTRLVTEERKRTGSTDTYLGIKFECIGLFNPADYGITV